MIKANIFRGKLALNNLNVSDVLAELEITRGTYNKRLRSNGAFNAEQISKLKKLLNLTNDEVVEIFISGA